MATTAQSGPFLTGSTWVGGAVPATTADIIVAAGHTLTWDAGTRTQGNDTTTAWQILGTLLFPNNANSDLRIRGSMIIANGGLLQAGTTAAPMQAGVSCVIRLNDSATMAANKYGLTKNSGGRISLVGAQKTHQTTLAAPVAAAGTSIQVSAASGWQVGDELLLLPSSSAASVTGLIETRFIASGYTPGSLTVPLTAGSTVARSAGAVVANLTRNVLVAESNQSFAAVMATATDNAIDGVVIQDAAVDLRGQNATNLITLGSTPIAGGYRSRSTRAVFRQSGGALSARVGIEHGGYAQDCIFFTQSSNASTFAIARNGGLIDGGLIVSTAATAADVTGSNNIFPADSGAMRNATIYGSATSGNVSRMLCTGGVFSGVTLFPASSTATGGAMVMYAPGTVFQSCDFAPTTTARATFTPVQPSNGRVDFKGCRLSDVDPSYTFGNFPGLQVVFTNCYRRSTPSTIVQELWANAGIARQTATIKENSTHSWEFETKAANTLLDYSFTAPISPGQTRTLKVRLRRDTTYGAGSMPRVRLSIPGQSDVVTAAPDNPDIWYEQTASITNSGSAAAEVTVSFETVGQNVNGKAWFSGLPVQPFIPAARWYGFVFDEANPFRVADPTITLSEAAAAAVTGVAIDHTAQTITVTATRTAAEVYCYCMLDLVNTLDASGNYRTRHITSSDGASFSTTYTVVISGAGGIAGRYSDANGAVVSATVSNIAPGSRILIVRTDTQAVLANAIVSGSSHSINIQTASAVPIRVEVRKASAAPFYQPWGTTGSIDPVAGFAATANQQPD